MYLDFYYFSCLDIRTFTPAWKYEYRGAVGIFRAGMLM